MFKNILFIFLCISFLTSCEQDKIALSSDEYQYQPTSPELKDKISQWYGKSSLRNSLSKSGDIEFDFDKSMSTPFDDVSTAVVVPQIGAESGLTESTRLLFLDTENSTKALYIEKTSILSDDEALVEIFSFDGNYVIGTITNFSTETVTVVSGSQADLFENKTYDLSKSCEPSYGQAVQDCFTERNTKMGWLSVALNLASIATR